MLEILAERKKGEAFLFLQMFLWAFFPIATVLSYTALPGLLSFAWNSVFAACFFGIVLLYRKSWGDLKNPTLIRYAIFITFFTGLAYYGLYFTGLQYTTPGNAAIIALFEVFTSFIFFNVLQREHLSFEHKVGAALMVIGALIVLSPNYAGINIGDFLILAATCFAPVGNFIQQKARKIASSESIMFLRYVLSAPIVFAIAAVLGLHASAVDIKSVLLFLVINGALILGLSKLLWIEAIHRMSVTKAIALNSMTPLLTILLAWVFLRQAPNMWQIFSLVPLLAGVILLTDQFKIRRA